MTPEQKIALMRERAEILFHSGWAPKDVQNTNQAFILLEYAESLGMKSLLAASQLVVSTFKTKKGPQTAIYAKYPHLVGAMRAAGYKIKEVERRVNGFNDLYIELELTHPDGLEQVIVYSTADFKRDGWPRQKKIETIEGVLYGRAIRKCAARFAADAIGSVDIYDESQRDLIEIPDETPDAAEELVRATPGLNPDVMKMAKESKTSADLPAKSTPAPPTPPEELLKSKAQVSKEFRLSALRDWVSQLGLSDEDERRLAWFVCTKKNVHDVSNLDAETLKGLLKWLADTDAAALSERIRRQEPHPEFQGRILK